MHACIEKPKWKTRDVARAAPTCRSFPKIAHSPEENKSPNNGIWRKGESGGLLLSIEEHDAAIPGELSNDPYHSRGS